MTNFLIPFTDEWKAFFLGHFQREMAEIERFWMRFPEEFDVENCDVLDFGSGSGCLPICLAKKRAKTVLGLEINANYTKFSRFNLQERFGEYSSIVRYESHELTSLEDQQFDMIFSKDVLEHVSDLPNIMKELVKKLKPGGKLVLGFGPLWHSPFGDHGVSKKVFGFGFPWLHLMMSEKLILKHINLERAQQNQKRVESICDFGMNQLEFRDYKQILFSLGLKVEYFYTNRTNNKIAKIIGLLPIPRFLERYFVRTIQCKLVRE